MSVDEFLTRQRALLADVPECWVIVANSVYARVDEHDLIAAFDTRVLAEEYVRASALPADWTDEQRIVQQRYRSFRPDSLLWDYNRTAHLSHDNDDPHTDSEISIVRCARNLSVRVGGLPINPRPPSGEVPPDVFAAEAQRRLESSRE